MHQKQEASGWLMGPNNDQGVEAAAAGEGTSVWTLLVVFYSRNCLIPNSDAFFVAGKSEK